MAPNNYKKFCLLVIIVTTVINLFNLGLGNGNSGARALGSGHSSGWSGGGHK